MVGAKVLVVDDEKRTRDVLEECLAFGGYDVCSVSSGEDGLNHMSACQPDLVITDMLMPDMNGIEFSRLVRGNSGVPIIMMTGLGLPPDAEEHADIVNVYLPKPIGLRALLDEVEAVIRGNRPCSSARKELVG